ncbi:MAG: type IV pilin-like G/H family protein [Coleofasciculus sp. A1-SPW-01]|uniref:type IV pilin-like G/H family protein n=1 Tax=Coleofasciculus sp. A1-SPW-01 TaxID=3070819 RepID=UPI0032F80DBB
MTINKNNGYDFGCLALLGIIGLAIAFPSFFNEANKCKYIEKNYIGSMNRAQQAYFFEKGNFTDNIDELGLGIRTETENYTNLINATLWSAINYSVSRRSELKSYVGGVFLGSVEKTGELTTFAILCKAKAPGTNRPSAPMVENGMLQCAPGTESIDGENNQGIFIGEDWKLANISANYASAGEYTEALDSAETITDDSIKSKTIHAIARYLTTATEHEQAIQVAKTMTDYQPKTKALDAIVRRLVATGNLERAVQIAQTIQSYYGGKEKAMAAIEGYKR